ncbi:MAG: polymer-forming cytoskeletal protein [Deltaproteobacteria bacterium]|nr:polymer-forming cytoskeletal protein [Deltaproteobacteria bacterium]
MKKPSVLPAGVRLRGEVEGEGDLIVFGQVDGPVRVDGALVIEAGGLVRGHVHARHVTVRGALKGDAFADEGVRVDGTARIVGDLTAPRVRVTPGAQFSGQVHVEALDAAPPLRSYDPALHTFTGLPSPEPISDALAAGVSVEAAPVDEGEPGDPDDTRPFTPLRERPSRVRAAAAIADVVGDEDATFRREIRRPAPEPPRAPAPEPAAEARKPAPEPPPKPPAGVGRMPRIGRVKGTHRAPS